MVLSKNATNDRHNFVRSLLLDGNTDWSFETNLRLNIIQIMRSWQAVYFSQKAPFARSYKLSLP